MPPEQGEAQDYEIRRATVLDVPEIMALQERNLISNGGMLSIGFPASWFEIVMREMPLVIARRGGALVGYLVASSRAQTQDQPIPAAKFAAYPAAAADSYNAGPLCIAASERGRGLALLLMDAQRRHLPGREATAFARADNAASRTTHAKAGYREVAGFTVAGVDYVALARRG